MNKRKGFLTRRFLLVFTSVIFILGLTIFSAGSSGTKEQPKIKAVAVESSTQARGPLPRKDSFFGLHFDLHPNESDRELGADVSPENIAGLLDRVKPDYVQYDCKGHPDLCGLSDQNWLGGSRYRPGFIGYLAQDD